MTVVAHMYGKSLNAIGTKTINLSTDVIKVMLVTSAYTPAQATDQFVSVPGAHEITGTGYTAGGKVLTSVVLADTSNVFTLSAANTAWTTATFSTAFGIVYDQSVGSGYSTYPMLGYIDFGGTQSPAGVTFEIDWASGVVFQWTAS